MANFAQLDKNDLVTEVIVVSNNAIDNLPFPDSEPVGTVFCQSLYGADTVWKQTSYNRNFRKNFAAIGYTYRADLDAFISPKPVSNPSWVLNTQTAQWEPPIPMPTDGAYIWDEPTVSWIEVPKPPYPSWTLQLYPLPSKWVAPVPYPDDGVPFGPKHYKWDEENLRWILAPSADEILDVP
jgi:hypothetical protein